MHSQFSSDAFSHPWCGQICLRDFKYAKLRPNSTLVATANNIFIFFYLLQFFFDFWYFTITYLYHDKMKNKLITINQYKVKVKIAIYLKPICKKSSQMKICGKPRIRTMYLSQNQRS